MSVNDPNPSRRTKLVTAGLFATVSALAGVVVAGLALPAAGAIGSTAQAAVETYSSLPAEFTAPPLPRKSVVAASDGTPIAELYSENRIEVPLDAISPNLQRAIIAIEDSRFYEHTGVDLRGTARALTNNLAGEEVQGGSTITMQYIKNLLVTMAETPEQQEAAREVSASRKIQEIRYAVELEKELPKPVILNNYLNISYFGAGAYGAEAAAQRYFSIPASQLNLTQAATLAGLVQSPAVYDPTVNPAGATERRNTVLARMFELGYIDEATYTAAVNTPLESELNPSLPVNGCAASIYPYFCDFAIRQFLEDPTFGETREERQRILDVGGVTINTTMRIPAQDAATQAVFDFIPAADPSGKAAAVAMVEPGTGEVVALTQNRTWGTEGEGVTTFNLAVDQEWGGGGGMQAGSTFKIFTVAAALEQGINPAQRVQSASKMYYSGGDWGCGADVDFEEFIGKNASNYGGDYDMWNGTALSANTYFIQTERDAGICNTVEMAKRAGIESATGADIKPTITFTLGVTEVSPLSVANAYATFAAHGLRCEPRAVASLTQRDGAVVETAAQCEQTIPRDVADATTAIFTGVVDGPIGARTGANMSLGREATGKTGTSDSNSAVWFAGYTPELASAVWVGDPRGGFQYPMQDVTINGRFYSSVYGGELPGPIWRRAMQGALADTPWQSFDLEAKYGLRSVQQGGGPNAAQSSQFPVKRGVVLPWTNRDSNPKLATDADLYNDLARGRQLFNSGAYLNQTTPNTTTGQNNTGTGTGTGTTNNFNNNSQ